MKLSQNTIEVLKNFANINTFMVLVPGNVQKSLSYEKTVMGVAIVEEDFPVEFGIYDLNKFLGVITSLNDPDVTFKDNVATIRSGSFVVKYRACHPEMGIRAPKDDIEAPPPKITFDIQESDLKTLLRLAASLSLYNLVVTNRDGKLVASVVDNANDESNYADIEIGDYKGDEDFKVSFSIGNLKVIPDTYTVEIIDDLMGIFTSEDGTRKYYISVEVQDDAKITTAHEGDANL